MKKRCVLFFSIVIMAAHGISAMEEKQETKNLNYPESDIDLSRKHGLEGHFGTVGITRIENEDTITYSYSSVPPKLAENKLIRLSVTSTKEAAIFDKKTYQYSFCIYKNEAIIKKRSDELAKQMFTQIDTSWNEAE